MSVVYTFRDERKKEWNSKSQLVSFVQQIHSHNITCNIDFKISLVSTCFLASNFVFEQAKNGKATEKSTLWRQRQTQEEKSQCAIESCRSIVSAAAHQSIALIPNSRLRDIWTRASPKYSSAGQIAQGGLGTIVTQKIPRVHCASGIRWARIII